MSKDFTNVKGQQNFLFNLNTSKKWTMDSAPINAENPQDASIKAEAEAATCNDSADEEVTSKILDLSKEQENAKKPLDAGIEAVATCSTDPETEKEQEPKKMKNKRKKNKKSHHQDEDKAERKAAKKKKKQQEEAEVTCSTPGATDPETEKEALEDDKVSRKRSGNIEIEEDPKKKKIEEIKIQEEADAAPFQGEGETSEKKNEVKFNVPKSPLGTPKGTASAKAKLSPF